MKGDTRSLRKRNEHVLYCSSYTVYIVVYAMIYEVRSRWLHCLARITKKNDIIIDTLLLNVYLCLTDSKRVVLTIVNKQGAHVEISSNTP